MLDPGVDPTYHLREYLVIHKFLWEMVNHERQIVQQAHTNRSIGVCEQADDYRCDLCLVLLVR